MNVTVNGNCGVPLAGTSSVGLGGLRWSPTQDARNALPAVQQGQSPKPPGSPLD